MLKAYLLGVVFYIPPDYVVTSAYKRLKQSYTTLKSTGIATPGNKLLLLVHGPKGVGKSLSLLALAFEWCSKQTCAEQIRTEQTRAEKVIYFTSSTLNLPQNIVHS